MTCTTTRTIVFAFFLIALSLPGFALAEDALAAAPPAEAAKPAEQEQKPEEKKEEAPKQKEVELPPEAEAHKKAAEESFALAKGIAEKLKPDEQKHFFILYNNYNLIETVKVVQGDVSNAVAACGKENPDMKEGLNVRLEEWNTAINPTVKDAEANIENMISAQEYAAPADIKKVFRSLDKTRKLANDQIEKVPVTTKDACEYLLEKMTDTQANFTRLMRSTLMSVPQLVPQEPEAQPAAEEKKEDPPAQAEAEKTKENPAEGPQEKAEERPAE